MKYTLLLCLLLAPLAGCSSSVTNGRPDDGGADAEAGTTGGDSGTDAGDGGSSGDGGNGDGGTSSGDGGTGSSSGTSGDGGNKGTTGEDFAAGLDREACEAPAIECGEIDLGRGVIIDCERADGNPTNTVKRCETYETCSLNTCTCENELELAVPPQCGVANNCMPGGVDLGGCIGTGGREGENWTCTVDRTCECTPRTRAQACGDSDCGEAPDGCGGTVLCNDAAGACGDAQTCTLETDATKGSCECIADFDGTALAFCADKCGNRTLPSNSCVVDCGVCSGGVCTGGPPASCDGNCQCTPAGGGNSCGVDGAVAGLCCNRQDLATLCAAMGAACGEDVTDPCTQEVRTCGCPAGDACLLARHRYTGSGDSLSFGGNDNVCVPEAVAEFAGDYAVRTHTFAEDNSPAVTRSETISAVTVFYNASTTGFALRDVGCVAANKTHSGNTSIVIGYWRLPHVQKEIEVDLGAGTWDRPFASPIATDTGAGDSTLSRATGFEDEACVPEAKSWLDGATCSCEGVTECGGELTPGCMPPQGRPSRDCRITDPDEDGRPGFTIRFSGGLANNMLLGIATGAEIRWSGDIVEGGLHTGTVREPDPLLRSVVGCTGSFLGCAFSESASAASCGEPYGRAQWYKLEEPFPPASELNRLYDLCQPFYKHASDPNGTFDLDTELATSSNVNQSYIQTLFTNVGPDCANNGDCPNGMICQNAQCWPLTTEGACDETSDCPPGWNCLRGGCWPQGGNPSNNADCTNL